ncbi:competence/damage-inducible protein A [Sphingobacterium hungaricum]|uniref:CinA-like protein n=1 Tax=Sphingobacterium hungaricum TaxID=2082723 RepID=A0A928UX56_9SPHI|nr:competence/damage-inducible protein A [Sphingobacterium hungaricum]MBE8712734.1 competence/damage-inducible protein A [Sphingobacterium hungaricum]
MNAEIITIGDEILLGQIIDTNSAWIAQEFAKIQIAVTKITSISDEKAAIQHHLGLADSNVVIVTGGLGPTKDDKTKESIAEFFGTELVRNEEVLAHIQNLFIKLGYENMPAANYQQADVLANADILFNDVGTAAGMWVEHQGKIFIFLPGVPFEMMHLVSNKVLPKFSEIRTTTYIYNRYLLTIGLGESHLAEQIADIENALPAHIKLAYLPKIGLLRLRLSASGTDEKILQSDVDAFLERIATRLEKYVVAYEDISIEEAFIQEFSKNNLKFSTAESCTGGGLASRITQYAGSSSIYQGSVVAYSNESKMKLLNVQKATLDNFGAVSEETVLEMAAGARKIFETDYAIATSGIAGPSGGTPEKPVGTVWIAIAGKNSTISKKYNFKNNRTINIERTIANAWLLLWKLYKEEN